MLEVAGNGGGAATAAAPDAPAAPPDAPAPGATPLKGSAAVLARYMDESRSIPTATSFRTITVTAMDGRRRELKAAGRRVSFTHLIAYAIARAATDEMPVMAHHFEQSDGKPQRVDDGAVNLGIAVDVERKDGSRTLMVPVIRDAGRLDFTAFLAAFDDLIERARTNELTADDLTGANLSLTNPGGIGTIASVPRLMVGQGTIVATGAIGYPPGLGGIGEVIGAEKVMTMTSTYDHRVIQGAESGRFLKAIEERLQGEHRFYEEVFEALGVELGPAPSRPAPAAASAVREAGAPTSAPSEELLAAVQAATSLLKAHRTHGHLAARLDPLGSPPRNDPALDPDRLSLSTELMARIPSSILRMYVPGATLADALPHLRETYCGPIAYEIEHITSHRQRVWLREKIESGQFRQPLTASEQQALLTRLTEVDALERFMHKAYLGQKQFSIEGLDMTVPMIDELIQLSAAQGAREVVIGMAHRGRLNVLAHNLGRPYDSIFAEFEGASTLEALTTIPQGGTGDVKYHHGAEGSYELGEGRSDQGGAGVKSQPPGVRRARRRGGHPGRADQSSGTTCPPRHQCCDPDRPARRRRLPRAGSGGGDAQPAGPGRLPRGRHDPSDPEQPGRLHHRRRRGALDPVGVGPGQGLRRADHPRQRRRRRRLRVGRAAGLRVPPGVRARRADRPDRLPALWPQRGRRARLHPARDGGPDQEPPNRAHAVRPPAGGEEGGDQGAGRSRGAGGVGPPHATCMDSSSSASRKPSSSTTPRGSTSSTARPARRSRPPSQPTACASLNQELLSFPDGFNVHPKLVRQLERRREALGDEGGIDWAHAEALAFASLLTEGTPIRLTGQDTERGTFSQRHMVLHDAKTGHTVSPIQSLPGALAPMELHNSPLSEVACLGFEYGYSQEAPETLVLWEAQFGDFVNATQVIVDQFIVSGLAKWGQTTRLTLLLPHGYEGSGPEHSSGRLERFLTLCAEGNIRVANVTTPAQYFHLLRRQARIAKQRPLVVMTPKSLLRLPQATNRIEHLSETQFYPVLGEPRVDSAKVKRLLLCTGKVYYDLVGHPSREGKEDVAVGRVELLYPFPQAQILELVESYPNLEEVVWVQEEPRNMGARAHMSPRLMQVLPDHLGFGYVGRPERASPGEGYPAAHVAEQTRIVATALNPAIPVSMYPKKKPGER